MNFRYNYTGNPNFHILEYETLFFSENDNEWKKTKDRYSKELNRFTHDIVKVDNKRNQIRKRYDHIDYNYYEYDVDIDLLLKEPLKINCLRNFIIAKETTDNYTKYIGRVSKLSNINEKEKMSIQKMDWIGGLNFKLELGILFPEILKNLVIQNEKRDLEETFRFIIFDILDINKIFEKEIKEYNKIMNAKING